MRALGALTPTNDVSHYSARSACIQHIGMDFDTYRRKPELRSQLISDASISRILTHLSDKTIRELAGSTDHSLRMNLVQKELELRMVGLMAVLCYAWAWHGRGSVGHLLWADHLALSVPICCRPDILPREAAENGQPSAVCLP